MRHRQRADERRQRRRWRQWQAQRELVKEVAVQVGVADIFGVAVVVSDAGGVGLNDVGGVVAAASSVVRSECADGALVTVSRALRVVIVKFQAPGLCSKRVSET